MIQYFKNINYQTIAIDRAESGSWVNVLPPLKKEEFEELSQAMDIPLDFLTDSLDIDERTRFEEADNVKLIVIKTPTENNSFNESDAWYITIYTNILSSTLDAFASIIANNQNEVLKRLSVITIVLTIPVLVASIYGMNVPIPYAGSPFAFYIPVFLSLAISLVIGWFFLKKKIF